MATLRWIFPKHDKPRESLQGCWCARAACEIALGYKGQFFNYIGKNLLGKKSKGLGGDLKKSKAVEVSWLRENGQHVFVIKSVSFSL